MDKKIELYDFKLTTEQEERARRLHDKAIIIDMLFQGPLSPYSLPDKVVDDIKREAEEKYEDDIEAQVDAAGHMLDKLATEGNLPEFKECWYQSGITAGNRQLGLGGLEDIISSICGNEKQFDAFDWLIKALKVEDIERAKKENKKAGIVTCQETIALGKDLDLLESLYHYGLRVVQLTYNNQNHVAAGCAEKSNAGVSNFGYKFIEKLNELGIVVDTGHCGKQTTLDACRISKTPVIATHTGAENVFFHMRCKSDEEIKAIASTGGVIGIFAMPWFIAPDGENTTLDHFLDHIDYVAKLVGVDHVGIGTDWPMTQPLWAAIKFKEKVAHKMGFKKGDGPSTEWVKGLKEYRHFINVTRGLVSRGYNDDEVRKILGENWMRVFREVWK